jgi:hypothetical protein
MHLSKTILPVVLAFVLSGGGATRADEGLVAHWPLVDDGRDISGNNLHATAHDIDFKVAGPSQRATTAAGFDGRSSRLEVPDHERLNLGDEDFTITVWIHTDEASGDVPGDIISKYDPRTRRGFHVALKTNAGVTFAQPNFRQLQFGIDQDRAADGWTDCGRPGNALLAFAMCSFDGHLYAGTCEPGRDESGHVYRYAGDQKWIDCGSPDKSNAVTALAEFDGHLYAGTGKYRVAGSALPESENTTLGGRVFRYDPPSGWIDCGGPRGTDLSPSYPEAVGGLAVFQGKLYASSLYHPPGFFRYEGDHTWKGCEVPARPADLPGESKAMRVGAIAVFNGALYGSCYDGGRVFRFDGSHWTDCGQLAENTQTYSFAVYAGELYVGTWPSGRVYRFDEPNQWIDCGRLGEELEVMGMLVHNGRLIAGTLPLAEVYQFSRSRLPEGTSTAPDPHELQRSRSASGTYSWKKLTRLDHTPDVRYRRAWCMAEHAGQVFCSTLPSGKIYSWRAGRVAMANDPLPTGWHHVAAVRAGNSLKILADGQQVAEESGFQPTDLDLSCEQPLQIGFGPNDYFQGRLSDVRLYRRALTAGEVAALAKK